ncbi:serine hydrolase [Deinococcus sp. RM]|uniref:serine hydrolase n=1 Tax=Deinococcus sp. RM TaxID=2316359 RepID=UPI0026B0583F
MRALSYRAAWWLPALLLGCAQPAPVREGHVTLQRQPVPGEARPGQPQVTAAPLRDDRGCLTPAPAVPKAPPPPHHLSGQLGLWVAEVDPVTLSVRRAVATNPDSVFPLASTYKQAVLWALLRDIDAGRVSPQERFDVTRQNQSLGSYPFDGSDVRTLSERMIRNSDNTATDILHRRVGLGAVQDVADRLGLCRTRLILPTKAWWVAQTGLSATFNGTARWVGARGDEQRRIAALIDGDAQRYRADYVQRKLNNHFDHRRDDAVDAQVYNLSTPYEFGTLVAQEFLRPDLSEPSRRWQRDVMALGYGKSALTLTHQKRVRYVGAKGGNGWHLLTYSGYIETTDGHHLVYVFMQRGADQTYTMPNTRRAFAWINAALRDVLARPPTP